MSASSKADGTETVQTDPEARDFGFILKTALFATGCAGVIAEFVLSTLATYLIGNAVFQWTIVMSLMLFAMGLGSRISRFFKDRLLDTFIITEFSLSILCAASTVVVYGLAVHSEDAVYLIYFLAVVIGNLIGFEIPLVTRINDAYEELRINISGVLEKDYYGALLGGLIFAFIALPYFGLTYTPIVLGCLNFAVASLILWRFYGLVEKKRLLFTLFACVLLFLVLLGLLARPIIIYGEQKKYRDVIIYSRQTAYQKIVMTRWKQHYWLYLNGQEQFSTYDEEKYHEPLVHPAMKLSADPRHVLIIGGGDGLAAREVLKHSSAASVTVVDLDPEMTRLAETHPVLTQINDGAFSDPRLTVINRDAARFVYETDRMFGVIIADLPDPDSVELMHVYSREFYRQLRRRLVKGGVLVTQATSPFFTRKAFLCLKKTVGAAGFEVIPYHNQIPTMGEWGWLLAVPSGQADAALLKERLMSITYPNIETRFLNRDAVISMLHFGKGVLEDGSVDDLEINTEINPVLYRYYQSGTWGVY